MSFVGLDLCHVLTLFAEENQADHPHAVERGRKCCRQSEQIEQRRYRPASLACSAKNCVLAPKPAKRENSRKRKGYDEHRDEGDLEIPTQPSHVPHVF